MIRSLVVRWTIFMFGLMIICDVSARSIRDAVPLWNIVPNVYVVEFESSFQRRFQDNQVNELQFLEALLLK